MTTGRIEKGRGRPSLLGPALMVALAVTTVALAAWVLVIAPAFRGDDRGCSAVA